MNLLAALIDITLPHSSTHEKEEEETLTEHQEINSAENSASSLVTSTPDTRSEAFIPVIKPWDKVSGFSDYICDGLHHLQQQNNDTDDTKSQIIMLYESPSSSTRKTTFFNANKYKIHDYPPALPGVKMTLEPLRYAMMNGSAYAAFLHNQDVPEKLLKHWESVVPGGALPSFINDIPDSACVYAYLPCECIKKHLIDPDVCYHLSGKDAIHLMSRKTPKTLSNTTDIRPCIAKTTHGFSSKGIFAIRNDNEEAAFRRFMTKAGDPSYVVTEFIEIERNVACHFFIHPGGHHITWFGSNESLREKGGFSKDSCLVMQDQDYLKDIQMPFVIDVVQYCRSLGFWGFMGIDVIFDSRGEGFLIDINPRVTGSCPSLMVAALLKDTYEYGIFRGSGNITYWGSLNQLFDEVSLYNRTYEGRCRVVVFSVLQLNSCSTMVNIGAYSHSINECRAALNYFLESRPISTDRASAGRLRKCKSTQSRSSQILHRTKTGRYVS